LNIGEEEGKGSQLTREAYGLLKESGLNFVGNVEGKDIPKGLAEVVVTDGFTGNVMLKLSEGLGEQLFDWLGKAFMKKLRFRLAALLLGDALRDVAKRLDYTQYGGALLLGVKGTVIICHGRSNATAIKNALQLAHRAVQGAIPSQVEPSAS
ncbi:MAG: phosphate--acyl-ACP acyltransferase, partial [Chloroflexota bacterium]|nr:phosphate--acyl-ACP acyltransferase [Chloroflexota bacterium]